MKVKWKEQTSRDIFEFYQKNVSKKSKVLKFEGETPSKMCVNEPSIESIFYTYGKKINLTSSNEIKYHNYPKILFLPYQFGISMYVTFGLNLGVRQCCMPK